mmetsp:Transcript_53899/g.125756  ORF Transcript_53899/g.125756 Transcript_53899/m.125756 type:complete len:272 (+) Transcript_53899:152-967(+)
MLPRSQLSGCVVGWISPGRALVPRLSLGKPPSLARLLSATDISCLFICIHLLAWCGLGKAFLQESGLHLPVLLTAFFPGVIVVTFWKDHIPPQPRLLCTSMEHSRVSWRNHLILLAREEQHWHLKILHPLDAFPFDSQESFFQAFKGKKWKQRVHYIAYRGERILQNETSWKRPLCALLELGSKRNGDSSTQRSAKNKELVWIDATCVRLLLQPPPGAQSILNQPLLRRSAFTLAVPSVIEGEDVDLEPFYQVLKVWYAEANIPRVGMAEQ